MVMINNKLVEDEDVQVYAPEYKAVVYVTYDIPDNYDMIRQVRVEGRKWW